MAEASTLRRAHRRDIPRLAELWAHAFPGERTVEQRIRQLESGGIYGGIDDAWYIERDGRLLGAFRSYPLKQFLHGSSFPMLGVAAVAVAADARREGIGGGLCRQALRIGRERGDLVSVLYPFRPEFYRRLGWGLVGTLQSFRFRPASLPIRVARPRVRLARPEDMPLVHECYARVAAGSHGLIERTDRIWNNHLAAAGRHLFMLRDAGGVTGYVLVCYGTARSAEQRALIVQELVAETDAAYFELLSWVALQQDQWQRARYYALPEERFDLLLEEPRPPGYRAARELWTPVAQTIRGPMLRVLDVPGALQARRTWGEAPALRFKLRVLDRELSENEGPWQVTHANGVVSCERSSGEADVELDAASFAQLFAGELSLAEAARVRGAATRVSSGEIDALFRQPRTVRLLDDF